MNQQSPANYLHQILDTIAWYYNTENLTEEEVRNCLRDMVIDELDAGIMLELYKDFMRRKTPQTAAVYVSSFSR
jgi:hypothetical protein